MSLKAGLVVQNADLTWHTDGLMQHVWIQCGTYGPNTVQVIWTKLI